MKKLGLLLLIITPAVLFAQRKVGIGTTAPVQRLSIDSTLNIDQGNFDDGSKPSLRFGDGSTGEALGSKRQAGGSNPFGLDFWTGFTRRMAITNAGFIGIGTDTPQVALAINGDVLVDYHATNNGVSGRSLRFGEAASGEGISSARSGSINPKGLNLFTAFTSRISIRQTGEVGVNNTNPLYTMHIKALSGQIPLFAEGSDATFATAYTNSTTTTAYTGNGMARQNVARGFVGINPSNNLILARIRPAQGLEAALTVVNSTGNIGIGTGAPQQRLSVDSTMNIDQLNYNDGTKPSLFFGGAVTEGIGSNRGTGVYNYLGLDLFTQGIPRLSIANNGYVGIGRQNPTEMLTVRGSLLFQPDTGCFIGCGSSANIRFGNAVNSAFITSSLVASFGLPQRQIELAPGGSTAMMLLENGNIGIANVTPAEKLDVTGNGKFSGNLTAAKIGVGIATPTSKLEIRDGALGLSSSSKTWELSYDNGNGYFYIDELGVSRRMVIKNGGNVGINTTSPTERLEVAGNGKFSGDITVQNGKGLVRSTGSVQQKTMTFNISITGPLSAGGTSTLGIAFPESFSGSPAVYVGGINAAGGSGGHMECVYNIASVTTTGCSLYVYNPRGSAATFASGTTITIVAIGPQ